MENSVEGVSGQEVPASGLGTEISGLFADEGLYSDIPELWDYRIKPASFGQSSRARTP